jgi:hypothetical protein
MMLGGTDEPDAKCRMQTACKKEGWVREGGGVAMCAGNLLLGPP